MNLREWIADRRWGAPLGVMSVAAVAAGLVPPADACGPVPTPGAPADPDASCGLFGKMPEYPGWVDEMRAAAGLPPLADSRTVGVSSAGGDASSVVAPPGRAHGIVSMGAVAQLFMEANYVGSDTYWKGALDWMATRAVPQTGGGVAWYAWENVDPTLDKIAKVSTAWNAMAFAEGYLRTGNTAYRDLANDAMLWLDNVKLPLSWFGTWLPGWVNAPGCFYFEELPYPHDYSFAAYGNTGIARGAVEVYRATGSTHALNVALCTVDALEFIADDDGAGGKSWAARRPLDYNLTYTGFCGGTSGIAELFIDMARTWPTNMRYEQLARAALTHMINIAVSEPAAPRQPAYKWPGREGVPPSYSVIAGGGAAGIGRLFLQAHALWGDQAFLDHAVGAGNYVLYQGNEDVVQNTLDWTAHFGDTNWCVGHIGPMNYLGELYDVTADLTYGVAYLRAANWLSGQLLTFPTTPGGMFPAHIASTIQTTDFIWGYTGLMNSFYQGLPSAGYLEPALSMYVQVLQWTEALAVPEAGGLVWQWTYDLATIPRLSEPRADVLRATVRPNPSRYGVEVTIGGLSSEEAGSDGELSLRVYDVSGRLVRVLTGAPHRSGGAARWHWDGNDDGGRRVPQGAYYAVAATATGRELTGSSARVTILD